MRLLLYFDQKLNRFDALRLNVDRLCTAYVFLKLSNYYTYNINKKKKKNTTTTFSDCLLYKNR